MGLWEAERGTGCTDWKAGGWTRVYRADNMRSVCMIYVYIILQVKGDMCMIVPRMLEIVERRK